MRRSLLTALSPLALFAASCGHSATGDSHTPAATEVKDAFNVEVVGTFDEPWAMAILPDQSVLVTEKRGKIKVLNASAEPRVLLNLKVDFGGQGGLGDLALAPNPDKGRFPEIYLSWVEAGPNDTRGAVIGRATCFCGLPDGPAISDPVVIWRQTPKVTGRGHFSHRIALSPDGKYLFIASGERQKFTPAQDLSNNLGKIVRLNLDGTPAPGNPFADKGGTSAEIWSYGHRNILGLQFDAKGRLWDLEHGPAGGDELNLVKPGVNFGWPLVSEGDHYSGEKIPRHSTRPDLAAPALSWNPVIAPGGMIFYSGKMWPEWKGQLLIGAMSPTAIVRVAIDGEKTREVARYPMDKRIRAVAEAPDGSLYVLEDKAGGRLLRLSRK